MDQQRRGRSIAMTRVEVDAFLAEQHTCRVATTGPDGPHATPLWFVWHGGALWLTSLARSRRWADLRRDPRIAVVVDAGQRYAELRGVELRGRVEVVGEVPRVGEPVPELEGPERAFADKYGDEVLEHDGRHGWLRLTPEKITSWDFRKLPAAAQRYRTADSELFAGFEQTRIDTGPATIHTVHGGTGPPVLLLHGFPQTSAMWAGIAPQLAETHTVVATDLRGYGQSSRPEAGADHAGYSFRAMAADQVAVMRALGHERFAVVGHDRGARVTHRLALDHPERVTRAAVLDILPTSHVYTHVDRALATAYYHWFFFLQPDGVPERLIAGDPIGYLHTLLGGWGSDTGHVSPAALASYERAFADPAARHAMLEDYRAGASIDLEHDKADHDEADHDEADRGRRVEAPLLALWGTRGVVGASPVDPLEVWRERGTDVRGATVDAGHFLVEERPAETLAILREFLAAEFDR